MDCSKEVHCSTPIAYAEIVLVEAVLIHTNKRKVQRHARKCCWWASSWHLPWYLQSRDPNLLHNHL